MLSEVRKTEIFPSWWQHLGLTYPTGPGGDPARSGTEALELWFTVGETEEIEEASLLKEIAEALQADMEVPLGRASSYDYPIWAGPSGMRGLTGRSQHEEDLTWFERNYNRLRDKYFNQWIAISKKQVVSHGPDPGLVLKEARRKGHPQAFITLVPGTWEEE